MKLAQLKRELEELRNEAKSLIENKATLEEIKNKRQEIELKKQEIEIEKEIENSIKEPVPAPKNPIKDKTKENANVIRAIIKKCIGKQLTEVENSLLVPTQTNPNGTNGEGYILPQDIRTQIEEKKREYKSLRTIVGSIETTALTGSFPIEDFDTLTELIDFTDGTDLSDNGNEIRFSNVTFSLKEKGALIKLSNTLLAMTDNNLVAYIVGIFAKKAVLTENKMILKTLQSNKTVKDLADYKALKSSINVDLDPATYNSMVIVTNQDGFNFLDSQLDTMGRPILQPNPANPTQKLFMGYIVEVFSNSMLATTGGKAPIFYGSLTDGVKVVDNGALAFATSLDAGFISNTTLARVIEFIDVVQADKSDKCYCYGEFTISQAPGSK